MMPLWLALVLVGLIVAVLLHSTIGILLVVVGLILLILDAAPLRR